jgi:organic radical activating enzyme
MIRIPFLEMDMSFACDLACPGCSHYSNFGHKGHVPFSQGEGWLRSWAMRVTPGTFSMLGGEPLLNPDLLDYLWLAGELWPEAERVLITNGMNLKRHPKLFETMADTGTRFDLSFHSFQDLPYLEKFNRALVEVELARQKFKFRMAFRNSEYRFFKTYRGEGAGMRPYAERAPADSWDVCLSKHCMTLHRGMLWKCPPLAFLELACDKFGLNELEAWRPYLAYKPLPISACHQEMAVFLEKGAEPACAMCPTRRDYFELEAVLRQTQAIAQNTA